ncbi:actin, cytoplasmic 2 [Nocardia tengchongensis]|uniref:actin, cytoplasmic 2 n=1 Tax=Nocardia tengchongensis TaxID=2055889 RepID=UPI0036B1BEAE
MSENNALRAVVIDSGTDSIKAGFSGDAAPRVVFPNLVGWPKQSAVTAGTARKGMYVGAEALAESDILTLSYPIARGPIFDWDDMTTVWRHTFADQLRVNPQEHPVLLTEPPLITKHNREQMARVMFETFRVPALFIADSSVATMHAFGRGTGLVVDLGSVATTVTPIHEGNSIDHAVRRLNVGGTHLTFYLSQLLLEIGLDLQKSIADLDFVREIKERLCYVAENYDKELERTQSNPDLVSIPKRSEGKTIEIRSERFTCPEQLFRPSYLGEQGPGLPAVIDESVRTCDPDLWKTLYGNIILSGGTSLLTGLPERLTAELTRLAPPDHPINVVTPPNRQYSSWIGASRLSARPTFSHRWITKAAYDENGPTLPWPEHRF